jgi:site-specific DNA-cytosine methylase
MTLTAIDCHGFGGGFTLGTVQAGFELVAKFSREKGFGVFNTLGNRHLLGHGWDSITGAPAHWDTYSADLVFGNPPCSGFSTLSAKSFRGIHSSVNEYMWELARYAGRVAPTMVIFESVQQTFTQGMELMRMLHAHIEEATGHHYFLYHVLHNNASLGGVAIRRRYFWVASRVPFGVDHYPLQYVPTLGDMLRDLEPLKLTMEPQPYRGVRVNHRVGCEFWWPDDGKTQVSSCGCPSVVMNSSRWCREHMHDGSGYVDGHDVSRSPSFDRVQELCALEEWREGETISQVLRRFYQRTGKLPEGWYYTTKIPVLDENGQEMKDEHGRTIREDMMKAQRLIDTDFAMGHNQQARWRWDKMARVITGGACHLVLHPHLPRTLTQREAARIQGFPDAWKIWPVRHAPDLGPGWGKGVPVHSGRWVADYARRSLSGDPGPITGVPLSVHDKKLGKKYGDMVDEFVIDVTRDYKPFAEKIGDMG